MNKAAINNDPIFGIGDANATFRVYMNNRPTYCFSNEHDRREKQTVPLETGDIFNCGKACGNGWRKVFNVYAKLVFALSEPSLLKLNDYSNWQHYRDRTLLQNASNTALIFAEPESLDSMGMNIIMGRTYGKHLFEQNRFSQTQNLQWLNHEFAVCRKNRVIISPYFDYRPLSNMKILYLVDIIREYFAQ
jgi:hypothetical protein